MKNEKKIRILLNGADTGNVDYCTNVECLYCRKVEALGYFQLSGMRYVYVKAVTQRI